MQSRTSLAAVLASAALIMSAGCNKDLLSKPEEMAGPLIPLRNCCAEETSAPDVAAKIAKPADFDFFASQAVYIGDKRDYRYVHVREITSPWGFLGERDYKIPASSDAMRHPMPLTNDASRWENVAWLDADGLPGVTQDPSLHMQPTFPIGAPKANTQPAASIGVPATQPAMGPG